VGDLPFNYVLVYDKSGSMRGVEKGEFYLSRLLLHTLTRSAKDRGSAVLIGSFPKAANGSTTDADDILKSIAAAPNDRGTPLYDALMVGVKKLDEMEVMGERRPRFLFLVSDGQDNQSRVTPKRVLDELLSSRTRVISVSVYASGNNSRGDPVLRQLAKTSGGWFVTTDLADSEPYVVRNNRKELDKTASLFRSWYWLRVQAPAGLNGNLDLGLKTSAHCRLAAPSSIGPNRLQQH